MRTSDYTVGWLCALPQELTAARAMLDVEHKHSARDEIRQELKLLKDNFPYEYGQIGEHYVVIACLPKGTYGTQAAAVTAERMRMSFGSLDIRLMVGVGGGVPINRDVRLGDVVVGISLRAGSGVYAYDRGKIRDNGEFEQRGALNKPPELLRRAAQHMSSNETLYGNKIHAHITQALEKHRRLKREWIRPAAEENRFQRRGSRGDNGDEPRIHYGLIASADKLMTDPKVRDDIAHAKDVLCFETEAAGLDNFECLVIRGISDYADSDKSKEWQPYAAAAAAAYAKELLQVIPGAHAADELLPNVNKIPPTDISLSVRPPLDKYPNNGLQENFSQEGNAAAEGLSLASVERGDIYIAVLCSAGVERTIIESIFDADDWVRNPATHGNYAYGKLGAHYVVLTALPTTKFDSDTALRQLKSSFPELRFCLSVGVAAGVPNPEDDIRLGDVVISAPLGDVPAVIQYESGSLVDNSASESVWRVAKNPPVTLLNVIPRLKYNTTENGLHPLTAYIQQACERRPELSLNLQFPGRRMDLLFPINVEHNTDHGGSQPCEEACDLDLVVDRETRDEFPVIHSGLVASFNVAPESMPARVNVTKALGRTPLCYDAEAANVNNNIIDCLVIRGIENYGDSHKNQSWHPYAAAVAAACAKRYLASISKEELSRFGDTSSIAATPASIHEDQFPFPSQSISQGDGPTASRSWPMQDDSLSPVSTQSTGTTVNTPSSSSVSLPMRDRSPFVDLPQPNPLPKKETISFNVPFPVNTFVVRHFMERIEHYFQKEHDPWSPPLRMCLRGMPGCGKTQLAARYCQGAVSSRKYDYVLWFNATSPQLLELDLKQAASHVLQGRFMDRRKAPESAESFKNFLRDKDKTWLIVFDNFDDPGAFENNLRKYIPNTGNGHVLVTSQVGRQSLYAMISGDVIDVERMEACEAEQLLRNRSHVANNCDCSNSGAGDDDDVGGDDEHVPSLDFDDTQEAAWKDLLEQLDYHALAVDIAASHIVTGAVAVTDCLEHMKDLLQRPSDTEYNHPPGRVCQYVFDRVVTSADEEKRQAYMMILTVFSHFRGYPIEKAWFQSYAEEVLSIGEVRPWMRYFLNDNSRWNNFRFGEAIQEFTKRSIIKEAGGNKHSSMPGQFTMHNIMQRVLEDRASERDYKNAELDAMCMLFLSWSSHAQRNQGPEADEKRTRVLIFCSAKKLQNEKQVYNLENLDQVSRTAKQLEKLAREEKFFQLADKIWYARKVWSVYQYPALVGPSKWIRHRSNQALNSIWKRK